MLASDWAMASDTSSMSDDSWQGIRSIDQRNAACQTDAIPSLMPLAWIIEEDRKSSLEAQAAAVAAPAQAAARSSAQPPAQLPQLGKKDGYFERLGDECGRWSTVNGDTRGASGCGRDSGDKSHAFTLRPTTMRKPG